MLSALNQLCYFVCFFALFVTCFVHNVATTISYDRKEFLDIRTGITHLKLDEEFFFNESDARNILRTPDQAQIPVIRWKRKRRFREKRLGCLVRIRQRVANLPLLTFNRWKINGTNWKHVYPTKRTLIILCFTKSWLNKDIKNIQLAGYTLYRQDRTAASGKTLGGGLCIYVSNSWCTISKEV